MTPQKKRLQGKPDCEQGSQLPISRCTQTQKKSMRSNGLRYPRWGGGRRSRPTGKMIRRRKLPRICAESPASGARFVGQFLVVQP